MSIFKKLSLLLTLVLFPIVVNANGGISVSTRNINLGPNESKTFTISATNLAGRVDISTSNESVASISSTKEFFDTSLNASSATITVTGKSVGTATIKVASSDVETFDGETITASYTITVNVAKVEVPTSSSTKKTTTKMPSKKTTSSTTKETTTAKTTTSTTSTVTTESSTTGITEETNKTPENVQSGVIKLDEFRVIGYDLKKENGKYTLNIDEDVDEIYVIASSKDESIEVTGTGIINIKNKNRVVIDANKDGINTKYIIKIQKRKDNSSFIIVALVFVIIGMLIYIIIDWNKTKYYR